MYSLEQKIVIFFLIAEFLVVTFLVLTTYILKWWSMRTARVDADKRQHLASYFQQTHGKQPPPYLTRPDLLLSELKETTNTNILKPPC